MSEALPEPMTPADGDLRDFSFTPIFRARLFGSRFHARTTDSEWRAGVTLWLKSWDQVPAGSLPGDDVDLCRLAELGRDQAQWEVVKVAALHGWVLCRDGLLYHSVVAEGVNDALARKRNQGKRGRVGASAKWGTTLDQQNKQNRHERLAAARQLGTHTKIEWTALVEFCGAKCLRCSGDVEIVKDHIRPLYQGGSDSIENLQPLCRSCNASKGADDTDLRPAEWLQFVKNACLMPARRLQDACEVPGVMPAECLLTPGNRQGQGQREGKKETTLRVAKKRSGVPPDWMPDAKGQTYAEARGVTQTEVPRFRNFHIGKGSLMADWDAAWRTWCDNAVTFRKAPGLPLDVEKTEANPRGIRPSRLSGDPYV